MQRWQNNHRDAIILNINDGLNLSFLCCGDLQLDFPYDVSVRNFDHPSILIPVLRFNTEAPITLKNSIRPYEAYEKV